MSGAGCRRFKQTALLDLTEIAAITDTPLGTVKSRLHRALNALHERLSLECALVTRDGVASHKTRADY
jgi:hypothetical protein